MYIDLKIQVVGHHSLTGCLLTNFPENHVEKKISEKVRFYLQNILPGVDLADEIRSAQDRCKYPIQVFYRTE